MKLLYVFGPCGSGKSTVAKFAESELGFARYGIDDYIREAIGGEKGLYRLSPVIKIVGDRTLQEQFWSTRNYSWDDAVRILADRREFLKDSILPVSDEERYIVGSGILGRYVSEFDNSLRNRNVVQEAGPGTRQAFENADADKYILKLITDPEIVIPRIMANRGWNRERAADLYERTNHDFESPAGAIWQMPNNTPQDRESIKNRLRLVFG